MVGFSTKNSADETGNLDKHEATACGRPPSKKRPTKASATKAISNQFQYLDS